MTVILNPLVNGLFLSPFGFNAVRYDQMAGQGNAALLAEALPMVEALADGLERRGVETSAVRAALGLVRNDPFQGSGVQGLLGAIKLGVALEQLASHREDYDAVADAIARKVEAQVAFSPALAEEGRSVLNFIRGRETLAGQPEYAKKYEELGRVARGGQADVRLVKLREEGDPHRLFVAWRPLETTAIGRIFDYARALERLDHPNIVRLVEVVRDREGENETIVLILEAAPGESVFSYLQNHAEVSAELLAQVRDQMLDALKYAWRQGLVHRDLKPENVMIAVNGDGPVQVTLLDYALAKFMDAIASRTSSVGKGSVCYMAPEQLHYDPITEATDIHGMGLVLLDLLRGGPRRDTVEENTPAEELEAMARRYRGDAAMEKLIREIGWMVDPDPEVRRRVLELEAWEEEMPGEGASTALIPISELATESAMAMVDLRPRRWLSWYLRPIDIRDLKRRFSFSGALVPLGGLGVGGSLLAHFFYEIPGGFVPSLLPGLLFFGCSLLTLLSIMVRDTAFKGGKKEDLPLEALLVMSQENEMLAAAAAKKVMTIAPNATRTLFKLWLDNMGHKEDFQLNFTAYPEPLFSRVVSALAELGDDEEGSVRERMELILIYHSEKTTKQSALLIRALDRLDPASAPLRRALFSKREIHSLYDQIPDTQANRNFLRKVAGLETYYHLQPTFTLELRRRALKALQVLTQKVSDSPPPGR